jgi:hypothetical protein
MSSFTQTSTITQNITLPAGQIVNADVSSSAAIDTGKQRHRTHTTYCQPNGTAVVADEKAMFVAYGASSSCSVVAGKCGIQTLMSTGGSDDKTVTVNVKKNGTTILTGTYEINKTKTAYTSYDLTFSSTALVAGDVVSVVITVGGSTGTQGQGVFVTLVFDEDAS